MHSLVRFCSASDCRSLIRARVLFSTLHTIYLVQRLVFRMESPRVPNAARKGRVVGWTLCINNLYIIQPSTTRWRMSWGGREEDIQRFSIRKSMTFVQQIERTFWWWKSVTSVRISDDGVRTVCQTNRWWWWWCIRLSAEDPSKVNLCLYLSQIVMRGDWTTPKVTRWQDNWRHTNERTEAQTVTRGG